MVDLDQQIVPADFHRLELQFLQLAGARAGPRLVFFFLLLIAPFAVIHDSANRRTCGGGNLNQVKPGFASHPQRFGGRSAADFFVLVVDQKDRRDADLLVVAKIRRNSPALQVNPRPGENTPATGLLVAPSGATMPLFWPPNPGLSRNFWKCVVIHRGKRANSGPSQQPPQSGNARIGGPPGWQTKGNAWILVDSIKTARSASFRPVNLEKYAQAAPEVALLPVLICVPQGPAASAYARMM